MSALTHTRARETISGLSGFERKLLIRCVCLFYDIILRLVRIHIQRDFAQLRQLCCHASTAWMERRTAQRINEQNRFIGIAVKKVTNGEKEDNV